ncbi:MAG: NAD(P)/FAD-dependent oxidoreductase [Candidatus Bathyarchaeota archaeon]|nr:NAD(P)/FAD-dependent oxidoreductase [Candidatus Bathyarchaeota archaeon]
MTVYDVVVVGGGTAGCIAATALAQQGYKTCILDQKHRHKIGQKVCGDAIGRHHFMDLGIDPPHDAELNSLVTGIDIYSPDQETMFRVKGEGLHGYIIDRLEFGQRLLTQAMDQGVDLHDRTLVMDPILHDNFVVGITAKDLEKQATYSVTGKAVVDASGVSAVLRKKMPESWQLETQIDRADFQVCFREIRQVKETISNPDFLRIFVNQESAPGGYYWIFPKSERVVNVGLGVQWSRPANPKRQLYDHVLSQPMFRHSDILHAGGGIVPTRRPINCMVGNGILFLGDVACQPNPIHGGGIGPSMISGKLAAHTLHDAFIKDDVSREALWPYNVTYMQTYGAKTAGLDMFRFFLQHCSDDDLNHGMRNRLLTEEDLLKTSVGAELHLNITEKAQRVFRGLKRLGFIRKLSRTAQVIAEIKQLYQNYPPPHQYATWVHQVESTIRAFKDAL